MSTKTWTRFTPFQNIHGVDSILPIECRIPSLHLIIELLLDTMPLEKYLISLEKVNQDHLVSLENIKVTKEHLKFYYDNDIHRSSFYEGDLILVCNQSHDKRHWGHFECLWHNPYLVNHFLGKGSYILDGLDGQILKNPCNRLYLKKYYPWDRPSLLSCIIVVLYIPFCRMSLMVCFLKLLRWIVIILITSIMPIVQVNTPWIYQL